ncbi:Ig-like domain-containing protein [Jiangella rhizosphaerae]|uniref:Ig-like domain-containing protein n=1 Tax=Jiangella rhizosphaerae TaxID=2293569 RepID=UPI0013142F4A|nr:Ig-like domain-containing protein [Jiangella rhizosphaerae]
MKRLLPIVVLACLLLAGLHPAAQAEPAAAEPGAVLYVAPDGDDAQDGTASAPLRTLEGARDAIRRIKADGGLPTGGVTVYLREGTYERTSSFVLGEQDSGTAEAPIVYRSYPGETVRLSGGRQLDHDDFVPVTDDAVLGRIIDQSARDDVLQIDLAALGITDYGEVSRHGYWKANDVSKVPPMQLYVGGQGMTLARWPNEGTVQMNEIIDPGPTVDDPDLQERGGTFSYTYDRPQYWTQAEDVWLDGIFGYSWEWSYNQIAAIDTEAKTITLRYGEMSGLMKTWYPDFHFAENLLEELDAPGEYYIDRATGVLYLMPNAAFRTRSGDVTVTMLKEPMVRAENASYITFDELVMEYGRATAATVLGGSNVTFAHSDIQNFTDGGVYINSPGRYVYDGIPSGWDGRNHAVVSSHLRHLGGVGVVLNGGDEDTLEPGNNRVENSHIHDFAYYHKAYNPGVMFDGVGNVARNNEIHDAPHPGIIVHGNDHLIEYNDIYDICKDFQDLGAIYMNAGMTPHERGTVIRRNYFHHTGEGRHGVEGVYPDNLTMGLTISENVFYRMGNDAIKSGSGDYIIAENNIFVDTFVPYDNYEMWMGDQPGNKVDTDYMPAWEKLFAENDGFVGTPYAEKYPELLRFFDENHYYPEHNRFAKNLTWNPTLTPSGDLNEHGARDVHDLMTYADNWVADQDPGFVDWESGDFRLTEDAAAFDRIPGFTPVAFEEIGPQGVVGLPHGPQTVPLTGLYLPSDTFTVELGATVPFRAEPVPWNATSQAVTYASSDPAVATVDADGRITALAPGETTVSVVSADDPAIRDEAVVTVADGDGVMHATDFESGGNGWPVDPNRSIVADDTGNHWYRILNGANGRLPREFGDYVLDYRVRTPAVVPEGAVMIVYDRNSATGSGYIRYRHTAAGPTWTIYDGQWGTVREVVLPAGSGFQPDTVYDVRVVARGPSVAVLVDGEVVVEGENPAHPESGNVGFYVEGFSHLDIDDVVISLVPTAVTGIEVSPVQLTMEPGESQAVTASVSPPDATNRRVDWSSSAPEVATVDADGTVRAVAAGTATITAASQANPELTATVAVEVTAADHPVIALDRQLSDAAGWTSSDAVDFDEGTVRVSANGVYGYQGERFGSGLLRFTASIGEFAGGWYGFAVRSDRTGDPTWVNGNKGYLVVIKEDQIEFQSWKPGQTMMDVIPNTAIEAGQEHDIEFGAVTVDGGTRLVLRVDGVTVWSGLDRDAANPIAADGYLNVYHYAGGDNAIRLTPSEGSAVVTGIAPIEGTGYQTQYRVGEPLNVDGLAVEATWSDGTTTVVPVTADMVSGFDSAAVTAELPLTITYEGATTTVTVSVQYRTDPVHRVTFDAAGGTPVGVRTVKAGTSLRVLPSTTRDGHRFDGWFTPAGVPVTEATRVYGPLAVIARWTPLE